MPDASEQPQDLPVNTRFIITTHPTGDVTTLTAHGNLDALTAPDFADPHAACRRQPAVLIIDLRKLDFLAVAGAPANDR